MARFESPLPCACPKDGNQSCGICADKIRPYLALMLKLGLAANRLGAVCPTCASEAWDPILAELLREFEAQEPTRERRVQLAGIVQGFLHTAPVGSRTKIQAELDRQRAADFKALP